MLNVHITSSEEQTKSIVKVLEEMISYTKSKSALISSMKDGIKVIDTFNKEHNLLDYDKAIFNPEYDSIIGHEILKTYDAINTDHMFSSVLQFCDASNLNLLEHLWSAILLVDHIIDMMNDDILMKYLSIRDFHYFIFLTSDSVGDDRILKLLNDLIALIKFGHTIKLITLPSPDKLYDILYEMRLNEELNKIDLLLLLDNSDEVNLNNLKIIETLGLVQPLSFIISTTENLTYSRYVEYSPWEKNKLMHRITKKYPGRWNLVYQTRCIKLGCKQGLDIEMTRCVEYLDG